MGKILNKPILEQMYEYKKEDFQKEIYNNCEKIKDIETSVYDLEESFTKFLKEVIKDEYNYNKAIEKLRKCENGFDKQIDFWNCEFYKLGILDGEKIRTELLKNN